MPRVIYSRFAIWQSWWSSRQKEEIEIFKLIGLFSGLLSDQLIFCGGFDNNNQESRDCWSFNLGSSAWREIEHLPQATAYASEVVINGRFYVIGGLYQRDYLGTVQMYDGSQWTLEVLLILSLPNIDFFLCRTVS